ncbi:MAG: CAP domain-containing protein, partial [Planctomycetota bacterium]|nr:CAP domain-containing protein [Planctomycetota bacterium]
VALRRAGDVSGGRALIAALRRDWAGADADRNARLDSMADDFDRIASGIESGQAQIRAEATRKSRGEQLLEIRGRADEDRDSVRSIVSRLLLSQLDELRLGTNQNFAPVSSGGAGAQIAQGETSQQADSSPVEAPTSGEAARFVAEQLAAVESLVASGRYADALQSLSYALDATDQRAAEPLREAGIRIRATVGQEMRALLDRVRDQARGGSLEAVDRALALLDREVARFPPEGEFGVLAKERAELTAYRLEIERRASLGVGGPGPASAPTLAQLRDLLAEARSAERAGDFGRAAAQIEAAATAVRSSDPAYAAHLDGRREDLACIGQFHGFVRRLVEQKGPQSVAFAEGQTLSLELFGDSFSAGGEPCTVADLAAPALAGLVADRAAPVDAVLGAAVLAYRAGERDQAEQLLARAVRADGSAQPRVDGILGRGRGETPGQGGYRLVDGAFVAVRELEVRKRAKELERVLARVVRLDPDKRDAELDEILSAGPQELDALLVALRATAQGSVARIERDGFRRHWEKVAAMREALDGARAHAKQLIYDQEAYFYPFRPPAVSAEKASDYARVQADVDARVAAVRELWEGDGPAKRAPKRLLAELEQLDWMVNVLAGFGERLPDAEDRVAWARALPTEVDLELRTFAWDRQELAEFARWNRVLAFNGKKYDSLSRAEITQVEITNAYRLMFGHRPLAVNLKLLEATRSHAEEMARLGYFSHYSPTPGRESPFDRMKIAGYHGGASENIANHPSAESAHHGWTHSAGHHRNLLAPTHDEFAVGNSGRLWVQNFGRGGDFEKDDDWASVGR